MDLREQIKAMFVCFVFANISGLCQFEVCLPEEDFDSMNVKLWGCDL